MAVRARITGSVLPDRADMDEIVERSWLDNATARARRRATCKRRDQPGNRLLAFREARARWRASSRSMICDPRLPRRRYRPPPAGYAGGDGGLLRRAPWRLILFARRAAAFEPRRSLSGARARTGRLASGEALPLGRSGSGARCRAAADRERDRRHRSPAGQGHPHALILRGDRGGWQGSRRAPQLLGEHRAGQKMGPGRAGRTDGRGRPSRSASSNPSAAPIRNAPSRTPLSRHFPSRSAKSDRG